MHKVYKRAYPKTDYKARNSAVLFVAFIRINLFGPFFGFWGALTDYKYKEVIVLLYTMVLIYLSFKRIPKSEDYQIIKKKLGVITKVYPFIILVLSMIWNVTGCILISKYIVVPYGLEGWLLRFFN